jgi:hypothetical protein
LTVTRPSAQAALRRAVATLSAGAMSGGLTSGRVHSRARSTVTRPSWLTSSPAVSVDTARRSAAWADGLITVVQPAAVLREVAQTYRGNGGRGPVALQVHLSWATAEGLAHEQWRNSAVPAPTSWDVEKPQDFDALTADVKPAQLHETVRISADLGQHRAWLAEYAEMGFDEIYLHHVGQEQRAFIDAFAAHVLPGLKEA